MNINKMLSKKPLVSPVGTAYWAKVNNVYDNYNDKPNYQISVHFDAENEAKVKKMCRDFIEQAKKLPEFEGKRWRNEPYIPCHEDKDGNLLFKFKTSAFGKDREGNEYRKYIPVFVAIGDTKTCKKLGNDKAIGNGSEVKLHFTPGVYWSSSNSNGVNLYLTDIMVTKLVEFGGATDDPSDFGYTLVDDDAEPMDESFSDEEVPI